MSTQQHHNFQDDDRFDGLYMNVAQTTRGIEPLLDSVFSFLRRKTDFLAGPPGASDGPAAAVEKVNEVLQRHVRLYQEDQKKKRQQQSSKTTTKTKKTSTKADTKPSTTNNVTPTTVTQPFKKASDGDGDDDGGVIEMSSDGGFDVSTQTKPVSKPIISPLSSSTTSKQSSSPLSLSSSSAIPSSSSPNTVEDGTTDEASKDKVESIATTTIGKSGDKKMDDDDGGGGNDNDDDDAAIPVGNGGTVDGKYVWTQTLADLVVTIPVPDNTRGRDLIVTIGRKHLRVMLKSAVASNDGLLVDGDLSKPIICDDSFWTVEDGNRLVINLQKQNQMEWWDAVCKGDPTINVRKINPENSSLSDLDGETRKTVEKMMVRRNTIVCSCLVCGRLFFLFSLVMMDGCVSRLLSTNLFLTCSIIPVSNARSLISDREVSIL